MAVEVTYEYYTDTYQGHSVAEEEWGHLSLLASAHLERVKSLCRVTYLTEDVEACESNAVCALCEVLGRWEDATGGDVTSESIGSVSVRYAGASEAFPKGLGLALSNAIKPWVHACRVVRA